MMQAQAKESSFDGSDTLLNEIFDFSAWDEKLPELAAEYRNAAPFPHIALDNFLLPDVAKSAMNDFKNMDWQLFKHVNENKSGNRNRHFPSKLDPVMKMLNSEPFLQFLNKLTGIDDLIADHDFGSGGIHRSTRGGFLNIHADFTVHPYRTDWHRRINVLIYLNENWEEEWGGYLELWKTDMSACARKVAPIFNRCVIFNTDYDSYHGHPEPMQSPEGLWRQSIAMYYYTKADESTRAVATDYRARPKDSSLKGFFIYLDKKALSVFHKTKTLFGANDTLVTNIFGFFNRNSKK